MEDAERYATAIHEAGHAVIGTLVGLTANSLTIEPTDDYLGLVTWVHPYGDEAQALLEHPEIETAVDSKLSLEDYFPELHADIEIARQECARHAMTLMAGPKAEERHTGEFDQDGADSDLGRIVQSTRVFFSHCGDEKDQWDAAVAHYDGPTLDEYLDDPLVWSWIDRVASWAEITGEMTGYEIRTIRPPGLANAMTDEGERIEAGDTVIQLVEQEGEWVPHFYEADGDKVRPPMPDDGTVYEWDEDFGWIEAPLT